MNGKRKTAFRVAVLAGAAVGAAVGAVLLACGTEEPGTNGPSEEYFPVSVGDSWTYDTWNLTKDPNKQHPIYTHVAVENLVATPGGVPKPVFVTSYAKNNQGIALQLNQAFYWKNKDLFFKNDYFDYGGDYFLLNGYHYLNTYHEAVIGTFFYNEAGQTTPFGLFPIPLTQDETWDVLNRLNPDPNNPTVITHVSQKDYFGLARDLDGDGAVDDMDISIVGMVEGRNLVQTEMGEFNCWRVVLTQTLVFHLTGSGDQTDVSKTTYWIADHYGIMKSRCYEGSQYLDSLEMLLENAWYVK
jgi:hypothetical protein